MREVDFSFQNFHPNYIIQSTKIVSTNVLEHSNFITGMSSSGFINQNVESRCYLNSTIIVQFFNVLFSLFILIVYFDLIINDLRFNGDNLFSLVIKMY